MLTLERSWAGLDTTGCGMGLGSTTTGSEQGITCCGTSTGITTGNTEVTGCGTLIGSTTTNSGLKINGVSALGLEQGSISKELARVFTA